MEQSHGRAPTMFMNYLIAKKGMNAREALKLLKSKRRGVHLHLSQIKALADLEKKGL